MADYSIPPAEMEPEGIYNISISMELFDFLCTHDLMFPKDSIADPTNLDRRIIKVTGAFWQFAHEKHLPGESVEQTLTRIFTEEIARQAPEIKQ